MNQLVVPVGYMGSGSSAITDIVGEFCGYDTSNGSFEFVFLHCPNGVFDLEDKLLVGNNALRSDEALHSFYDTMKQLYDKKWWWVGGYRQHIGERFLQITQQYLAQLVQFSPCYYWYMQENTNTRMFWQLLWRKLLKICTFGKVILKKPLLYKPVWIAYPTPEEFYQATQQYLSSIWKEMGIERNAIVLDQLLLPHNLYRIERYFHEELRAIVVSRDPRDVFIINKYIWPGQGQQVIYPVEVEQFCVFYQKLRQSEKRCESKRILRIQFEDLVYQYEESIKRIRQFLGVTEADHRYKGTRFQPERSIENTQLFTHAMYRQEADYIAEHLPQYIYEFPYQRTPDIQMTF